MKKNRNVCCPGFGIGPGCPRRGCGSTPQRPGQLFSHPCRGRLGIPAGTYRLLGRGIHPVPGCLPRTSWLPASANRAHLSVGIENRLGRLRSLGGRNRLVTGRAPGVDRPGSTLPAAVTGRERPGCSRCCARSLARPSGAGRPGAPDPQTRSSGESWISISRQNKVYFFQNSWIASTVRSTRTRPPSGPTWLLWTTAL